MLSYTFDITKLTFEGKCNQFKSMDEAQKSISVSTEVVCKDTVLKDFKEKICKYTTKNVMKIICQCK